jgi:hypothetical protein
MFCLKYVAKQFRNKDINVITLAWFYFVNAEWWEMLHLHKLCGFAVIWIVTPCISIDRQQYLFFAMKTTSSFTEMLIPLYQTASSSPGRRGRNVYCCGREPQVRCTYRLRSAMNCFSLQTTGSLCKIWDFHDWLWGMPSSGVLPYGSCRNRRIASIIRVDRISELITANVPIASCQLILMHHFSSEVVFHG